jgi:hypothetical protein
VDEILDLIPYLNPTPTNISFFKEILTPSYLRVKHPRKLSQTLACIKLKVMTNNPAIPDLTNPKLIRTYLPQIKRMRIEPRQGICQLSRSSVPLEKT